MRLTDRDAQIIRAVHRHRFLRSHQIAELIGGSRQQILRRLQLLFHHRYLERPLCQLDYFQNPGSRSIVYGLGTRGAAFLRRVDNIPFRRLDWSPHNGSVKRLFLEHALMISDIMLALEIACRKLSDVRLLIEHEIPLPDSTRALRDPFRWTVTVSGKGKLGVIPDRVFALEFTKTQERLLCFLEADRGTMPVERAKNDASSISRKFHAYAATWKAGIHRLRFDCPRLRAVFITTSAARCDQIEGAIRKMMSGGGLFFLATIHDVQAPSFFREAGLFCEAQQSSNHVHHTF